ncbi:MAG: FtsQ-type POTRA domain-containing protein [Eubacteriales bacterium]|nr:FtsQ-type POTRA domain-containing protein [Eubacteriales bacterium]
MDTTQKPRGEAPARRPKEAEKRPQNSAAPKKQRPPQDQRRREGQTALRPEEDRRPRPAGKPRKKAAPAKKPLRRPRETDDTLGGKRRSYGNSRPKKKSALVLLGQSVKQAAQRSAAKREAKGGRRKQRPQIAAPAVIYTEPKTFNRSRFLVQMTTVVALVAALVLGLSVFFKVKTITVSGAQVYSAWAVREASGIQEGDNLLSFGNARAGAQIKANLPYVNKVRLGIKLPDTVNIMIEEEDVVYAIKSQDGIWWLMTSDGRVVEQASGGNASNCTKILGVTLESPAKNETAVAAENAPTETNESGEPIPAAVTGAQRLNAALEILRALEDNGIVGDAASVEVARIEDIILWYGTRYQVNLGDASRLPYKIACMNDAILQLSDYQSGILDISFTIWPDQIGYTPFA